MATCKAGSLAAFVVWEKVRRNWRGGIAVGRGERREFSHFWPGVRSARPELRGDLAVGLLGKLEGLAAEHGRPEVRPELSSA
jgi:hypothetical protein